MSFFFFIPLMSIFSVRGVRQGHRWVLTLLCQSTAASLWHNRQNADALSFTYLYSIRGSDLKRLATIRQKVKPPFGIVVFFKINDIWPDIFFLFIFSPDNLHTSGSAQQTPCLFVSEGFIITLSLSFSTAMTWEPCCWRRGLILDPQRSVISGHIFVSTL